MTKKTDPLLEKARKHAKENISMKSRCWFDHLVGVNPTLAKTILGFCLDWKTGGEARKILPRLSELHRFISCELGDFAVKYQAFSQWIDRIEPQ